MHDKFSSPLSADRPADILYPFPQQAKQKMLISEPHEMKIKITPGYTVSTSNFRFVRRGKQAFFAKQNAEEAEFYRVSGITPD
ncbi:MAG: hypothetical protein Q4C96_05950 [Planctomycetia bacterium]|nr:hypothetical protein [Planctomycetia bacterium]